jgi:hypothetical protein
MHNGLNILRKFSRCFPIVPKLAADHLHLSILHSEKPLTVLGGLTSFGGAGNNYSMHVSYLGALQFGKCSKQH